MVRSLHARHEHARSCRFPQPEYDRATASALRGPAGPVLPGGAGLRGVAAVLAGQQVAELLYAGHPPPALPRERARLLRVVAWWVREAGADDGDNR
eukprot:2010252-Pyramimonas_sp.AAC.1